MNEHPGVQPTIVKPQTPSPKPMRSLPRNTTVMPLGLSANSVGLDGRTNNVRRMLLTGASLAVVLVLSLGIWLSVKNAQPLAQRSITNGLYEYNFLFYKEAEPVNLVAGQGFRYDDKALLIAKPTDMDVAYACEQMNTRQRQWREAFRTQVVGVERPVCRLGEGLYAVTFFAAQAEHLVEISYIAPYANSTEDVRKIVESLQVTLQ